MDSDLIEKYFGNCSPKQKEQFDALGELYNEWNAKINVVSRKDIDELYLKHVLHSLGIAKVINFKAGSRILDVGTGGGFPGIPLSILFPEAEFDLVDSIGKKIKVVKAVATALELSNVNPFQSRAEDIEEKYDFVVSRAVTRLSPFMEWIKNKFRTDAKHDLKNGVLYLKGGNLLEELEEYGGYCQTFELSNYFKEEFFETKKVVYVPVF